MRGIWDGLGPWGAGKKRQNRRWRLTTEGKVFIAIACIVGLAAVNTGNNLVYLVFGLMLTLMLLSGLLSEFTLRGVSVTRVLPPYIYARLPALMQIALRNHKRWLSSYSLKVSEAEQGTSAQAPVYFGWLGPHSTQRQGYAVVFERRGPSKRLGLWLTSSFPFGLVEKSQFIPSALEHLVFPEPRAPLRYHRRPFAVAHERVWAAGPGQGDEIVGIREYQRGDAASSIHWRRSASLGALVTRERSAQDEDMLSITIDTHCQDGQNKQWFQRFEDQISQATGLIIQAMREGNTVEVVTPGAGRHTASRPDDAVRLLGVLARLEPTVDVGSEHAARSA
ncbi:MAG: DUF58 domain-containing protein [Myxococcales bacterium]|nr:DUF58 domain-containing protein [Myxococcales bacterium]MCB9707514.1 DUF58 domain-containing protein [Myxococcales bacterium]